MRPRTVYGVYCELHCGAIAQDSILSQHISDHIYRSRMTLHRTLKFKSQCFPLSAMQPPRGGRGFKFTSPTASYLQALRWIEIFLSERHDQHCRCK